MNSHKKWQVERAIDILEESVLNVLMMAKDENGNSDCLGPSEISQRTGIYSGKNGPRMMHDAIVAGILTKLLAAGKVERCKQNNRRGGWRVSQKKHDIPKHKA